MKEKQNIAVLFGGCSPEYDVSLQSAYAVIKHMDRERFTPIPIGITRQGGWYCFEGSAQEIAADTWHTGENCAPVTVSPDRQDPVLYKCTDNHITEIHVDAAFPVLHGKNGEDGTVQGLFELMGVPVVGCGVLASALCMDKHTEGACPPPWPSPASTTGKSSWRRPSPVSRWDAPSWEMTASPWAKWTR